LCPVPHPPNIFLSLPSLQAGGFTHNLTCCFILSKVSAKSVCYFLIQRGKENNRVVLFFLVLFMSKLSSSAKDSTGVSQKPAEAMDGECHGSLDVSDFPREPT
jgi:hypothetical protein